MKQQKQYSFWSNTSRNVLCCFVLLFLFSTAKAQSDTSSVKPQKNFVLRTLDWGYGIIEGDDEHPRKVLLLPIPIVAYKPETRWILGLSMNAIFRISKDSITRPSSIRANVSYSQNKQFAFMPEWNLFTKHNKWNLRGNYTYTNFGENYYGIGRDVPASNKEFYSFDMQRFNIKATYQVFPKVYAGVQFNSERMYHVAADTTGLLYTDKPKGYNGYHASGMGFTVSYDNRDQMYYPHSGQFVELSQVLYTKTFGGDYEFSNFTLDARKYIRLWKENVLALQGFVNMNEGNIPFRMLGVLGSDMYMRGYYRGRYRDQHAMAFQAELRKTVWGPVALVVFAGGGTVASHGDELFKGIKPNIGAGLRFLAIPKEHVNISIDYGWGNNGNSALYIGMHEAF